MVPMRLFVAGYGRSGTTAFELETARRLGAIALGEVGNLPLSLALGDSCSCGVPFPSCEFWGGALDESGLLSASHGPDFLQAVVRAEFGHRTPTPPAVWTDFWGPLLATLESSGAPLIDSTKTARGRQRLRLLGLSGWVTRAVLVNRELGDVASSVASGSNTSKEFGHKSKFRFPGQTQLGWSWATLSATRQAISTGTPLSFIDFDQLVSNPDATFSAAGFVDVWPATRKPILEHGVGGNRARREGRLSRLDPAHAHGSSFGAHRPGTRFQKLNICVCSAWMRCATTSAK